LGLEEAEGHVVDPGEGLQLDKIHATLARFTLGEERLRLLQFLRGLYLGQSSLQPGCFQPEPELGVRALVVGGLQGKPILCPLISNIPFPYIPNSNTILLNPSQGGSSHAMAVR
jgi:hypothetical protein